MTDCGHTNIKAHRELKYVPGCTFSVSPLPYSAMCFPRDVGLINLKRTLLDDIPA